MLERIKRVLNPRTCGDCGNRFALSEDYDYLLEWGYTMEFDQVEHYWYPTGAVPCYCWRGRIVNAVAKLWVRYYGWKFRNAEEEKDIPF